jgi:hypothetical protein
MRMMLTLTTDPDAWINAATLIAIASAAIAARLHGPPQSDDDPDG